MDIFSHLAVQLLAECSRIRFTEIRAKCGFGIVNGHTGQKTPFYRLETFYVYNLKQRSVCQIRPRLAVP